jgi:hypothetical protein
MKKGRQFAITDEVCINRSRGTGINMMNILETKKRHKLNEIRVI